MIFIVSLFALRTAGGLAVVRVPGAEGGAVAVLVPAGVALGRSHPGSWRDTGQHHLLLTNSYRGRS